MNRLINVWILLIILCSITAAQGSVWQREAADSTGTDKGQHCKLAIDSEDNPHIAYFDADFQDLRYAYYNNGTWTVEIVDSIGDAGRDCSIALDSQDVPHISYQHEYLGYHWSLKYATLTDTGWYKIILDCPMDTSIGEIGEFSSIEINNDGYPCISYLQDNPDEIKYMYLDESGWHLSVVQEVRLPRYNKLRLMNGETPIIGFHRLDTSNNDILELAYFETSDSSWSVVTIPDSVDFINFGHGIGYDIDSENNAYFAFFNPGHDLHLASYDGSNWSTDTILVDPYFGGRPTHTLTIDNEDNPCLATFQSGTWFYRKHDGQLDTVFVDDFVSPGWYCSLRFDSENYPRISAYARTENYSVDALFYYRYWPGDPQAVYPDTSYNFGIVWTESYAEWKCPIANDGTAPLILHEYEFASEWYDSAFEAVDVVIPNTILPQESDSFTVRFNPIGNETYFDTLIIRSNDTLNPEQYIAIQGTGTTSGDFGDLTVYAKNCYAALEYHQLNEIPLRDAEISLYRSGQLMYGPVETETNGTVEYENVAVGNYDLHVSKQAIIPSEDSAQSVFEFEKPIEVGPGTNTEEIVLPESLAVQKYQSIYDLTHIIREGPLGDTLYTFRYPSEVDVKVTLDSWIEDLDPTVKLSIARLYLAERMTNLMFDSGYSIGGAFIRCISELINFLFFSESWIDTIVDFLTFIWELFTDPISALLSILNEFIKYAILSLMDDAVQQAAAEIPTPGDVVVVDAWGAIKGQYSGWTRIFPGFSDNSWDETEKFIHRSLRGPVFQEVYVDILTDGQIENALNKSENFNFYGDFADASEYTDEFISNKSDDVETDVDICQDLIVSALLFHATATLLDLAGELIPGAWFLSAIGDALETAAYIEVIAGIALSGHTLFTLPDDMNDAVNRIYNPDGLRAPPSQQWHQLPKAQTSPQLIAMLKENLQQNTADFDSVITEMIDYIQQGETEEALLKLDNLMEADVNLKNSLRVSCAPIYAVAYTANDSIPNFPDMYDTLIADYADAGMQRVKNLLYMAFLPSDTTQAFEDTIVSQLDRSVQKNNTLYNRISETLDSVSVLSMPAIVMVNNAAQNRYDLGYGETAVIQLQVQNVGSLPADSISLVLTTNDAIAVEGGDSIYIGTLSAGEESSVFSWNVGLSELGYTRGIWTAEILSSNAKTFSYSGSFGTPDGDSPPTGGRLSSETVYSYPNPFNPSKEQAIIRYSLANSANVTIKIFDVGGNIVTILIDNVSQSANEEYAIPWNGKNGAGDIIANGVYFFVIESSVDERAVGKIAALR
ncbi:MAG: hypothetical protein GY855_04260 [candidate division Zixibacteria bacterium]|nr:hypothetical protein [candidate division Zixibacteria bacterium]